MNTTLACDICKSAVALVADEAKLGNFTIAATAVAVDALCNLLGGAVVRGECKILTDSVKKIATLVANGLSKTEICQRLSLCIDDDAMWAMVMLSFY